MLLFWKSPIWNESLNVAFQWSEIKCSAINDQQTLIRQKVKLWEYEFVAWAVYIIIYYINPLTPLHINGYLIQSAKTLASASCERHSVGKVLCASQVEHVWEMKWDPHKQVADKLIWAVQFGKPGFAEVPLKFQDFRGSENPTLSPDEWHRLSCSSPEALGSF